MNRAKCTLCVSGAEKLPTPKWYVFFKTPCMREMADQESFRTDMSLPLQIRHYDSQLGWGDDKPTPNLIK